MAKYLKINGKVCLDTLRGMLTSWKARVRGPLTLNIIDNWLMIIDGDYSQAHQAKASSSHIINISAAFYGLSRLSWDLDWHRGRISCILSAYWPWLCCWGFGQGWRCRIGLIWLKILPFNEGTFVGSWRYLRWPMKVSPEAVEGIMLLNQWTCPCATRCTSIFKRVNPHYSWFCGCGKL